jgi:multicomponent K+:H+ antiporter subunit C
VELLVAVAIGLLVACGVYLMLRGRTFTVVLGLTLLSYAVNFFIFAMGRLATGVPALVADGAESYADPLPQALVLTAIVIGFGTTGFLIELALRASAEQGSDHVDGAEPARDDEVTDVGLDRK